MLLEFEKKKSSGHLIEDCGFELTEHIVSVNVGDRWQVTSYAMNKKEVGDLITFLKQAYEVME